MTLIGVGLWALSGVEAVVHERRRARRIEEVTGVGGRPMQVSVQSASGQVGLSMTWSFE